MCKMDLLLKLPQRTNDLERAYKYCSGTGGRGTFIENGLGKLRVVVAPANRSASSSLVFN